MGGGPHGLTALSALHEDRIFDNFMEHTFHRQMRSDRKANSASIGTAGKLKKTNDVLVIDPAGGWMKSWDKKFKALGIKDLRSPVIAHPDLFSQDAMLEFAMMQGRMNEISNSDFVYERNSLDGNPEKTTGQYGLPTNELFLDFCLQLAARLPHTFKKGAAVNISHEVVEQQGAGDDSEAPKEKVYIVHLENGERVRARRVIIAIGHEIVPQIPKAFEDFCPPACWPVSVPVPQQTEEHASEHLCNSGHTNCNHQHLHEEHAHEAEDHDGFHDHGHGHEETGKQGKKLSKTKRKKAAARRARELENAERGRQDEVRDDHGGTKVAGGCEKGCTGEVEKKLVLHTSSLSQHWQEEQSKFKNVLVIGGGLSAAQAALCTADAGVNTTLLSRRPLVERDFDLPLDWFERRTNNLLRSKFGNTPDSEKMAFIKATRGGGSVPRAYLQRIRKSTDKLTARVGEVESVEVVDKEHGKQILLIDGLEYDRVILATGCAMDISKVKLFANLQERYPYKIINGLPRIDASLRLTPKQDIFICGGFAALRIGPDSLNLMGSRLCASILSSEVHRRYEILQNEYSWSSAEEDDTRQPLMNRFDMFALNEVCAESDDDESCCEQLHCDEVNVCHVDVCNSDESIEVVNVGDVDLDCKLCDGEDSDDIVFIEDVDLCCSDDEGGKVVTESTPTVGCVCCE